MPPVVQLPARGGSHALSKVVGIDHISIRVSDYAEVEGLLRKLFEFLGFEISDEYPNTIGWTNGKTRYWIAPAEGRKKYRSATSACTTTPSSCAAAATSMPCRPSSKAEGVRIVDPADEYYEDYYAVFFLDPDGIKLEGMKYGELTAKRKRKPLKKKG